MDNKHLVNIAINHINEDNAHNIDGIRKDIIERIDDEGNKLSTSIERSAEEIKLQASKINDITSNISDLSITAEEIIANVSSIKKTTAGLLDEQAQMSMKSDEISASVSRSNMDIEELNGRIQSAEFKITPEAIVSTVTDSTTYTDDISGITTRLNEAEHKITAEAITSTVRGSVEYQEDIEGLESGVSDLTAEIDGVETRVASAESTITQHATSIESKVSATDFNGATIASKISQSPSTVKIDAKNINLNGAVTFSSFSSTLQSDINNKADSSDLGSLAYRNNIAKSNMSISLQNEINAKLNESTIIEGGYIKTSYIDTDVIISKVSRINSADPDSYDYTEMSSGKLILRITPAYDPGSGPLGTIRYGIGFNPQTQAFTIGPEPDSSITYQGLEITDSTKFKGYRTSFLSDVITFSSSASVSGLPGNAITRGTVPYSRLPSDNLVHSSGSNARGKWIRFGSGIQMCWYNTILTYSTGTTIDNSWTYPMPFIDPPSLSGNSTNNSTVAHRSLAVYFASVTSSSCTALMSRPTDSTDFTTSDTRSVSLMAVGMWK